MSEADRPLVVSGISGVLVRGSLINEMFGLMHQRQWVKEVRPASVDDRLSAIARGLTGHCVGEVTELAETAAARVARTSVSEGIRILRERRARSEYVLGFTRSPDMCVRALMERISGSPIVSRVEASRFIVEDGRYTGDHRPLNKHHVVTHALRHGSQIDLAVVNGMSETPIVHAAASVLAFNPGPRMAELAQRHGWDIVRAI